MKAVDATMARMRKRDLDAIGIGSIAGEPAPAMFRRSGLARDFQFCKRDLAAIFNVATAALGRDRQGSMSQPIPTDALARR